MEIKMIPNRQFKFVLIDCTNSEVRGTDDQRVAQEWSNSPDNLVIDMTSCQVIEEGPHHSRGNIPEQTLYSL